MRTDPPIDPDDDATASFDFASALESFERDAGPSAAPRDPVREVAVGKRVTGRVTSIGPESVIVDFGGRSEGVAETRHFRSDDGTVRISIGDVLDLYVVEAEDQVVLAPSFKAEPRAALQHVREAKEAGAPLSGRVTGLNAGGLAVELGGVRAFCPLSQIEAGFCADPSVYVGRTLEFLVTTIEGGRGGVVVSRKQLLKRSEEEQGKRLLASLKAGETRTGTVTRLEPFGAFVDLGGIEGLVHVSEVAPGRVSHPGDVLRVGELVTARVLAIEAGKEGRPRISLSIKATAPDPWETAEARFPVGARVRGVVARLAEFGAFVTLAPGLDGLVHVSEAGLSRIRHVRDVLAPGETVEAIVLVVDRAKHRISLSVKAALEKDAPPEPPPAAPAPREPAREAASAKPVAPPPAPAEETTMGIALRKAREAGERRDRS